MAKNTVSDWSTNDALNTDIGSTNIAEGCPPSGLNDALRKMMAQIATWIQSAITFANDLIVSNGTGSVRLKAAGDIRLSRGGSVAGAVYLVADESRYLWYDGASYVLSGAGLSVGGGVTATGTVSATVLTASGSGTGKVSLIAGDTTHTGYMSFLDPSGIRKSYIGYQTASGAAAYHNDAGTGHVFDGGALNSVDGLQVNGQGVWHAGNLNPSIYAVLGANASFRDVTATRGDGTGVVYLGGASRYIYWNGTVYSLPGADLSINGYTAYHAGNFNPGAKQDALGYTPANRAGDTFTGPVRRDALFYMDMIGGQPSIAFDAGDYLSYDRTNDKYLFRIGNSVIASIDASGNLRVAGNIYGATAP